MKLLMLINFGSFTKTGGRGKIKLRDTLVRCETKLYIHSCNFSQCPQSEQREKVRPNLVRLLEVYLVKCNIYKL
jgi:hypothetical protein